MQILAKQRMREGKDRDTQTKEGVMKKAFAEAC